MTVQIDYCSKDGCRWSTTFYDVDEIKEVADHTGTVNEVQIEEWWHYRYELYSHGHHVGGFHKGNSCVEKVSIKLQKDVQLQ
jgi:hypothetical protein